MLDLSPEFLAEAKEIYGFSEEDLQKGYQKGLLAWSKETAPPGSTPQQLGKAVVEQMILIRKEQLVKEDKGFPPDSDTPKRFKATLDDGDARKKASKTKKKDKDKEDDTKYTNNQPGDVYASARMGGISGAFSTNIAESLPDHKDIKEWALKEETQKLFLKKYGDKAEISLIATANRLYEALNKPAKVVFVAPEEPVFDGGPKRKAYDLMKWHTEELKKAGDNKELTEWHMSKIQEHKNKVTGKNALDIQKT